MIVLKKKPAKNAVSDKILDMRLKIKDEAYIENAVQRIALVLSRRLVEQPRSRKEAIIKDF